jgi:phosphoglycerate dehydrogenase-like enzyme
MVNGGTPKILVNTARHQLVNIEALYHYLKQMRIKAAFDGWPSEEYAEKIRNDISNEYLIVTPHQAFNTDESKKNASELVKECVATIMDGNQWKYKANRSLALQANEDNKKIGA